MTSKKIWAFCGCGLGCMNFDCLELLWGLFCYKNKLLG